MIINRIWSCFDCLRINYWSVKTVTFNCISRYQDIIITFISYYHLYIWPRPCIYDCSLSWLGIGTSNNRWRDWTNSMGPILSETNKWNTWTIILGIMMEITRIIFLFVLYQWYQDIIITVACYSVSIDINSLSKQQVVRVA
jgi:hypothetical protein